MYFLSYKYTDAKESPVRVLNGEEYDAYKEDISILHVFWDSPTAIQVYHFKGSLYGEGRDKHTFSFFM